MCIATSKLLRGYVFVLLSLSSGAMSNEAASEFGKVALIKGEVSRQGSKSGHAKELKRDATVFSGDIFRTNDTCHH